MAYLANPLNTMAVLNKYGFTTQKKYGQNFLIDANVLEKIVSGAEIGKDDCVLEIGPGIGTMTQYLAEAAGRVAAVEIDSHLLPVLEDTLSSYNNVTVIHEDILKTDISGIVEEYNGGRPIKVVANLPYYITTPVILRLLECGAPVKSITVMVQKEVAERMEAGPGSKDYGAMSLAVQYYARPEILTLVSASCFLPRPSVDSAVIRLVGYEKPPVTVQDERFMFALIRAAFNQRRKTLANSLANAASLQVTREQVTDALLEMGLPAAVRGEVLTLAEFAGLSDRLLFTKNFTKSF
ncbi:MAG: 16S rRNA (adenine(1518)-N(6)/adenine(1519)-N(6))-dimethyltransferase RsmA [Lachnospiraceae bacterium]|nr:16S rRNA (adenine(1518)-N(6)/adenine(1519)-N(6))-dimethyltransferase RsmA [Lachnospiraceae bacterium]